MSSSSASSQYGSIRGSSGATPLYWFATSAIARNLPCACRWRIVATDGGFLSATLRYNAGMKRSGSAATHVSRRDPMPLITPNTFRRRTASIVSCINSASVAGDHTGSAHGGFLVIARNSCAYGACCVHPGMGLIGVHTASGGGPWLLAAEACKCMSIIGSRVCSSAGAGASRTTATTRARARTMAAVIHQPDAGICGRRRLQPEPVVELHHEHLGASSAKAAAENAEPREYARPRFVKVGHVPHQIHRAAAAILPAEHHVAAQRLVVEIRISFVDDRLELVGLSAREFADVGVIADGHERLHVDLERHIARERVGRADGHAYDIALQGAVDVIIDPVARHVGVLDPLRVVDGIGVLEADRAL